MVNFMGPGGGMAIPPYLQGRKPMITPAGGAPQIGAKAPQPFNPNDPSGRNQGMPQYGGTPKPMTQPMITPKQSVMPGETNGAMPTQQPAQGVGNMIPKAMQTFHSGGSFLDKIKALKPPTPPNFTPVQPAQLPTSPISPAGQSAYDVLKGDLEDQRRSAMSGAVSDASARGVYYGSPLTTSQGDIQTQYLRGLGQLQAGVLGNEQQNELSRLGIASNILGQNGVAQGGKIDPQVMQMLGGLFAPNAQRPGPAAPTMSPGPYKLPNPNDQVNLRGVSIPNPVK